MPAIELNKNMHYHLLLLPLLLPITQPITMGRQRPWSIVRGTPRMDTISQLPFQTFNCEPWNHFLIHLPFGSHNSSSYTVGPALLVIYTGPTHRGLNKCPFLKKYQ